MLAIESALPGVTVTEREDLGTLGTPIDINGCSTGVLNAVERLSAMSSRLKSIDAHPAFILLQNCLSMPRLQCYWLHSEMAQSCKYIAASIICNEMFERYRVTTVNPPRRTRRSWPLLGSKCVIACLCILLQCH